MALVCLKLLWNVGLEMLENDISDILIFGLCFVGNGWMQEWLDLEEQGH